MDRRSSPADGRPLPARLAPAAAPRGRALRSIPARCLSRWPVCTISGPGITDRAVRQSLAPGSHDSAPVADDGGTAAAVAGRAALATVVRLAVAGASGLGRSISPAAAGAPLPAFPDFAPRGVA